ncbi:MAG: ribosome maturation factor RimM [Tannerellaceae bacterium]|jgi:16S rRNA processing protein RimM|nr:ribosome maturation factor RimM [Tannerellaceae bacterium]
MISKENLRKIGSFTKPHGIKGEIGYVGDRVASFVGEESYIVCEIEGTCVPFFIEGVRRKTSSVQLFKLAAVDSADKARRLSGKAVYCPAEAYPEADDEADNSWSSLCGYILEDQYGESHGAITAIDDSTPNILLVLEEGDRTLLVPAVEDWIIDVDHAGRRLQLSLPAGLLDI